MKGYVYDRMVEKTMGRWRTGLTLLLVSAFLGAAPAAAEIRLLTWAEYVSPDLLEKFRAETGVPVATDTFVSVVEMRRKLAENPGRYDIVTPPDYDIPTMIAAKALEPIDASRLPGYANLLDGWRSPPYDRQNADSVPFHWGTTSVVVDTAVYAGTDFSLNLLFDPPPELKGRVGFLIGAEETLRMALMWLGLPQCTSERAHFQQAVDLVRPLLHKDRIYDISNAIDKLAGDDIAVGIAWNGDALRARERKPTLRYLYPSEGLIIWSDALAVPAGAPNRADALRFIEFTLQPENAAIQSNYSRYANTVRGSDAHMDQSLLDAPEVVIPPDVKIRFFRSCDSEKLGVYSEVWDPLLQELRRP